MTHTHPKFFFVPRAVLIKSGLKTLNTARQNSSRAAVSVNTARPVNTAYPRPTVNSARTASNVFNRAHSHVRRPFNKFTTNKNINFKEKVNTVRENITTVGPKVVVSDNKGNEANEKGVIDSGCSRHMTGNKSHLSDYKEIDGGFVAFGGNPKGGTKESIDAGQAGKKTVPSHEYILLPLWTLDSPISSSPKRSDDEVADDAGKKSTKDPTNEGDKDDQDLRDEFEREFESSPINTAGTKDADDELMMPNLEDTGIFGDAYDDEDFVARGDMNN
ncbi:hypothetical protein Tco_0021774, partial [Tanacetum coccineum]